MRPPVAGRNPMQRPRVVHALGYGGTGRSGRRGNDASIVAWGASRPTRSALAQGSRGQGLTMGSGNPLAFRLAPLLLALTVVGGTAPASAQGTVKSVHNDWQIRCDTPPGAQGEQCALIQSVTAEDRANVGLTVIVLKTADQKSRLMRVVAPMGVLLPSGLGL